MPEFFEDKPLDSDEDLLGSATLSDAAKSRLTRFTAGNEIWRLGLKGRLEKSCAVKSPEDLLEKVCSYLSALEDNPLQEGQLVSFQGSSTIEEVPKMRAPTLLGLCAFLGIYKDTWGGWRRGEKRKELQPIVRWAEQVMHDIKFTGAAAGLLNAGLIGKDLGLVERSELSGPNGAPLSLITNDMTPQQAAEAYAATLRPQQD